jgi:hypothetical protein
MTQAGWKMDPTGRHQFRYHNGTGLTGYVSDNGVVTAEATAAPNAGPQAPPTVDSAGPVGGSVAAHPEPVSRPAPPPSGPPATKAYVWPPPSSAGPSPARGRHVGFPIAVGVAVLAVAAVIVLSVALIAKGSSNSPQSSPRLPLVVTPATRPHPTKPHATTSTTLGGRIGSTLPPSGSFSPDMGTVVYSSNFGANEGWSTCAVGHDATASLANGRYVVTASTDLHHVLDVPYGISHDGISVETAVTAYPQDNVSLGTGCQSAGTLSPALVYQMVVYPAGEWYLEQARLPGAANILLSGGAAPLGTSATVQLTCVMTSSGRTTTTQLAGYVNGIEVAAIADQVDGVDVGGYVPLLLMGTMGPKVTAAFAGVTERSLSSST